MGFSTFITTRIIWIWHDHSCHNWALWFIQILAFIKTLVVSCFKAPSAKCNLHEDCLPHSICSASYELTNVAVTGNNIFSITNQCMVWLDSGINFVLYSQNLKIHILQCTLLSRKTLSLSFITCSGICTNKKVDIPEICSVDSKPSSIPVSVTKARVACHPTYPAILVPRHRRAAPIGLPDC